MSQRDPSAGRRRRLRADELACAALLAPLLLYAAVLALTGEDGLRTVEAFQVAVRADHPRRALATVDEPGIKLHLPWLQEIELLDRRPVEYVMHGNRRAGANLVPGLMVRGREGTSYGFDRVEILYALDPDLAPLALADSGPGLAFADGIVDACARAVLRDAFGRHDSAEMVEPDTKQEALAASREALARALAPHGIVVHELSVSKPVYAPRYEETIARRKAAETDLEAIERDRRLLLAGQGARAAQLAAQLDLQLARERGDLQAELSTALRDELLKASEAEAYRSGRLLAGELARDERASRAATRVENARKEAEGLRAGTEALAVHGATAVRAALVEKLAGVSLVLAPLPAAKP